MEHIRIVSRLANLGFKDYKPGRQSRINWNLADDCHNAAVAGRGLQVTDLRYTVHSGLCKRT